MMHLPFYKLMLVTNMQTLSLSEYLTFIYTCALAGITSVQLREKERSRDFLLTFGRELKRILDPLQIPLIINDDLELALALGAAGVHLGQSDGDPQQARRLLGPDKIIGVTIDKPEQLIKANSLPIDYVGIGAVFPTKNKKNVATIWGIEGLKRLSPLTHHPIIGIGGIHTGNAATILAAGARGIAVIGALHDAKDPHSTTQQLRHILDNGDQSNVD